MSSATAIEQSTPACADAPANPVDWKELAAAYHAHHFNCPTFIAAGRGSGYGQRCGGRIAIDLNPII